MIINHNMSALFAQRQEKMNTWVLDKNLEKLSSGLRITRAGDDASGLAVSEKMRSQIRGLQRAEKNTLDGISFIQTTEGYLQESQDIIQRLRELAVQAANGIYSDEDRMQIQVEVSQLVDEIVKHLQEIGIDAEREEKDDAQEAHAFVGVIAFDTPEFIYRFLYSKESERRMTPLWGWGYKNPYVDNLLDSVEGVETYRKIQEVLSAEHIFIPLFRRGIAVTHTKDLDTKSRLRVTGLLYGPDVVHWEFK